MMTSVYSDADYLSVYKQRKKVFALFWAVSVVYLAFCVGWVIYYTSLPYADARQTLPKVIVYAASVLYVVFAMPYAVIKMRRVHKYYKTLYYFSEGLKTEERNFFYKIEKKFLEKDDVVVLGCVFEKWNKKKREWLDREAYWDLEKPAPNFENGDEVRYIVQNNFILQYDIVRKKVLEFEAIYKPAFEGEDDFVDEVLEK